MVAVVVLVLAIVGIVGSMLSSMALTRVNRETAIAQQAARRMIEEITGTPTSQAFVVYNGNPNDAQDQALELGDIGPNFAVQGLQAQDGDPDGMCGRIVFPVVNVGGFEQLREDVVDAGLGMPRDLDNDGVELELDDMSDSYVVLPVRVLVEWRGVSGNRQIELETMMSWR
jgi:type II secretory pathway pseudopilin PulG